MCRHVSIFMWETAITSHLESSGTIHPASYLSWLGKVSFRRKQLTQNVKTGMSKTGNNAPVFGICPCSPFNCHNSTSTKGKKEEWLIQNLGAKQDQIKLCNLHFRATARDFDTTSFCALFFVAFLKVCVLIAGQSHHNNHISIWVLEN